MSAQTEPFSRSRARALAGILTLGVSVLTLATAAEEPASVWQSPDSIRAAARDFVLRTVEADSTTSVEVVALDERLKLPACATPLHAQAQSALRNGQGTVAVSCAGAKPWRLFVPVRAFAQVQVVVAGRSIQAGEVLAAADLTATRRSSAALPYEYLTDPTQAVGSTVRRTLAAGTVLVPAALDRPTLVERGDVVTLVTGAGAIVVKTEGVALEAAKLKQRVRIRSQSGRVIEGVVESARQVRVGS